MPLDPQASWVVLPGLVVLVLASLLWLAVLQRSSSRLRVRLRALGSSERGLDEVLDEMQKRLDRADERLDATARLQQDLEALLRRGTVRNVAVVRFNPFPDAGGDQSFALALLDSEGSGVVVSSLHARTDTRIFAKPVSAGRSRYPLSQEEQDAIRQALASAPRAG